MRFEPLPQIVSIGLAKFTAFSTGFWRNAGQLFFASHQNSTEPLLQVAQFFFTQLFSGLLETLMQVSCSNRFISARPSVTIRIHHKRQFAQQMRTAQPMPVVLINAALAGKFHCIYS